MTCAIEVACGAQLQVRYPILAAVIPVAEAAAGREVNLTRYLRDLRMTDSKGRHAHIAGVMMRGTYRFTTDVTNAPLSGWDQLGHAWQNIRLTDVSGWGYLRAQMDARALVDDRWLRTQRMPVFPQIPPIIGENIGAGNQDRDVSFAWPLVRPGVRGPEALHGLVPLAAVAARADGFLFTVGGQSGPVVNSNIGITGGGFVGDDLEIYLDIVWLDQVVTDRPWEVETYTSTLLAPEIRHQVGQDARLHEYLTVWALTEDDGSLYYDDFGSVTLSVNGDPVLSGITRERHQRIIMEHLASQEYAFANPEPSLISPSGDIRFGILTGPKPWARPGMAGGKISVSWDSRTRAQTRFLHRTVACQDVQRVAAIDRCTPGCARRVIGIDSSTGQVQERPQRESTLMLLK